MCLHYVLPISQELRRLFPNDLETWEKELEPYKAKDLKAVAVLK